MTASGLAEDGYPSPDARRRLIAAIRYGNTVSIVFLALYFLLIPGVILIWMLTDPALRGPGIPRAAWRVHRTLTPRYERWARARVQTSAATELGIENVSGTEWPLFGSVFYLWATESLQEAWDGGDRSSASAPAVYARGAIEAAAALVTDPGHAAWVKKHWGKDYLHTENVFYRMLIINACASHARLLKSERYLPLLRDQTETLSAEIDASPHGLLQDYPGECYPTDVLAAIAAIRRADRVLGADHSAFVRRAVRAFQGELLDKETGLVPYGAFPWSGRAEGTPRGCANSYMTLAAPELWPEVARDWFRRYEEHFWQYRLTAYGFREFPKGLRGRDWYFDVDSGPVIAGHGVAASAFGVAGTRVNGRFDRAWPLSAEMLVTCCPLLDGTLAAPRVLSNAVDAPYLGEAGVLYCLTRRPAPGFELRTGGRLPPYVCIVMALYFLSGAACILAAAWRLRRWKKTMDACRTPLVGAQFTFWVLLLLGGVAMWASGKWLPGILMILAAQLLPRDRRNAAPAGAAHSACGWRNV